MREEIVGAQMNLEQASIGRDNNFNLLRMVAASAVLVTHSFAIQ